MAIQEEMVANSADRTDVRQAAGEALARLPELFAMHHGPHPESMAFSYIANRLLCLAAKPVNAAPIHETNTLGSGRASAALQRRGSFAFRREQTAGLHGCK